jgi:D-alanine-D-alanine ligase
LRVLVLFDIARSVPIDESFGPRILRHREDKPTEADVITGLRALSHEVETLAVFDDVLAIIEKVRAFQPDIVFNLSESFHYDRAHEPNIPAMLNLMKVRYTGCGPEGLLLCKDKVLTKKILAYHHVRVPRFVTSPMARPLKSLRRFVYPAFVKPIGQESSDGISQASLVRKEEEALERARFIHDKFRCDALIEEYIDGRELYVSVIGNHRITVFPPREIFFEDMPDDGPKFATFKAKWDDAYRERWGISNGMAGPLEERVNKRLASIARTVYRALKIRGPGRIDVRLAPDGEIVVIEANPNPSLAKDDDFSQSALAAGVGYDGLLRKILDAAA